MLHIVLSKGKKLMLENKNIAVVVPAFNEQELIVETVSKIPAYVDFVIVVDDASEDNTVQNVEKLTREALVIIKHPCNKGVGGAIVTGYRKALLLGADVIAVMGADNQMHFDDLISVLMPVIDGSADYSKGNRFKSPGCFSKMPKLRIVGNVFFSIISCIASGYYHIFDTQCGFTAINKNTLQKLDLACLYRRYGFPTDMLVRLGMISARVVDVPVRAVYNTEKSGIKPLSYTFTVLLLALKLFVERQTEKIFKKYSYYEEKRTSLTGRTHIS